MLRLALFLPAFQKNLNSYKQFLCSRLFQISRLRLQYEEKMKGLMPESVREVSLQFSSM